MSSTEPTAAAPVDRAAHHGARAPGAHPELAQAVAARVAWLQGASTAEHSHPQAVAALARLRRGVGRRPGALPEIWDDTISLVPGHELGRTDEPSSAEHAAHTAMTVFALHRQGASRVAHARGATVGRAVRDLSRARAVAGADESEGVRRRFDAVLTAGAPAEGAHHLRGLVLMLRDEGIPLDYGQLAADLADLWTPGRADRVRLRWARQYRSTPTAEPGTDTLTDPAATDPAVNEEQA